MTSLTNPQKMILKEMVDSDTGGLYIARYMRYFRTAIALVDKGYATRKYADSLHDFFEPTPKAAEICDCGHHVNRHNDLGYCTVGQCCCENVGNALSDKQNREARADSKTPCVGLRQRPKGVRSC